MTKGWQAWIFDLDDTLLDTSGALIPHAAQRICEFFVSKKLFATLKEALSSWDEIKPKMSGKAIITKIVESRISDFEERKALVQEAYHIFRTPILPNSLPLLPGGKEILNTLSTKVSLFLVTQGDISTQMKKVEILNLSHYFKQVYYVDPFIGENKSQAFKEILKQFGFDPEFVLCIGNRIDNEIELSKELKMKTCYMAYGEYKDILPQNINQKPDFRINHLLELQSLIDYPFHSLRQG